MLKSFTCKETKKVWEGNVSRRLPRDIQVIARRKLRMINNAQNINDLRVPPANRLETLIGNRKDQYSIRINKQWRVCFNWNSGDAYNIEIVDYHS